MRSSDFVHPAPEQYAIFWHKLQQAVAFLETADTEEDINIDIVGSVADSPVQPCSIFQARGGLPATATWSTVKPEQVDVSQTSLVATILGVTAERLLVPSPVLREISFHIGKCVLAVRRVNQHWAQSFFHGSETVYKELLQIDRVAQILAPKQQ